MSQKLKSVMQEIEFGTIKVNLDKIMKERNISTYELSKQSNIKHQSIQSLRENTATRIDFVVLAKICYVLDIKVEDILEYEKSL